MRAHHPKRGRGTVEHRGRRRWHPVELDRWGACPDRWSARRVTGSRDSTAIDHVPRSKTARPDRRCRSAPDRSAVPPVEPQAVTLERAHSRGPHRGSPWSWGTAIRPRAKAQLDRDVAQLLSARARPWMPRRREPRTPGASGRRHRSPARLHHVEGPSPPVHAAVHVEAGDDQGRHWTGRLPTGPRRRGDPLVPVQDPTLPAVGPEGWCLAEPVLGHAP